MVNPRNNCKLSKGILPVSARAEPDISYDLKSRHLIRTTWGVLILDSTLFPGTDPPGSYSTSRLSGTPYGVISFDIQGDSMVTHPPEIFFGDVFGKSE